MPDPNHETLQRVRRIETRLTQTMIALGIPTGAQQPVFEGAGNASPSIRLPSPHTSFKEALSALPAGWSGTVAVYVGSERIGTFSPDRR